MWMVPLTAHTTRVERRMFVRAGTDEESRDRIITTHQLVHAQDVQICSQVQRSHDAGIDADGRLATVEERGVYFVHQQLRQALAE
jgi:hypothetical protein